MEGYFLFQITIDDHLYLRMLTGRDAADLFHLVDVSREYLREWLPWVDTTRTPDDSLEYIKHTLFNYDNKSGLTSGIFYKDQLVGVVGFNTIDSFNHRAEIGYWLGQSYQGKGIMTRATKALIDYGFSKYQLNRIEIQCASENKNSQAIPERLGFTKEACLREVGYLYDHYVDHYLYSLLRTEWKGISTEKSDNS